MLSGLQITASDSPFGIFKPFLSFFFWLFCCLVFKLRVLIAPLESSNFPCPFFWLLCCLAFKLLLLIAHLASSIFLALFRLVIVLAGLQIKASDSPFDIFKLFLSFFFWLLCCLAFKLRLLIALLTSSNVSCPFSFGYCAV